jgi:hypothetical protein
MQSPQFDTQNDPLVEDGIHSIPQWRAAMTMTADQHPLCLIELDLDPDIRDVFLRLRNVFIASVPRGLSTTDLHDLTIFLLHKLLAWSPQATQSHSSDSVATSQCVRYALVLYMLIIHGPAYFSHAHLQINLVSQFKTNLEGILAPLSAYHRPLALWMLLVGLTASHGTPDYDWFTIQAKILADLLHVRAWTDVVSCFEEVLWYQMQSAELLFQARWWEMWALDAK